MIKRNLDRWTTGLKETDRAKQAYDLSWFLELCILRRIEADEGKISRQAVSWEGTGYDFAALV
ncbi:hypothetical protein DRP77_03890 [Candidatus Poribacteria bacterium]|nr:MAG: hypothetical protein DRP77_03890 [Candidatus Poribacteria bacterium]